MPATDPTPSDAEVMAASVERPHRFATIFDRHHESIHRYLWTRADGAADDLAAEVFRIAFERRGDFDPSYRSAKPWLFGIAANLAKRHHRRTARRRDTQQRLAGEDGPEPQASPEDRLARLAGTEPVADAVRHLPDRDREPLLLYAWEGLAYDEIAEVLDVPVGTVRSRIHRARSRVKEHLELEPAAPETEGERR